MSRVGAWGRPALGERWNWAASAESRADMELKIWISGTAAPIQKQFNKKLSIYEVQSVLASYVLR